MTEFRVALEEALEELRKGKPILVADDADRENEVDAIFAAETATPSTTAWVIRHSSGYLCAPMTNDRADALELPVMVEQNEDSLRTTYTITCDAASGVTTGISAADRTTTLRALARKEPDPRALIRPGHVVPLRARDGGVLERSGHTEAAVDLTRLAGLVPVAGICELVNDDGTMMRLSQARKLAEEYSLKVITIADLVTFRRQSESAGEAGVAPVEAAPRVERIAQAKLPTDFGEFTITSYRDLTTGAEHVALVPVKKSEHLPLVRVHSECLTGDAFGSKRCDCGPQLHEAMLQVANEGGAIVYLRGHEGRGIGLSEKVRAYRLQDEGEDTAQANLSLGWPVDMREYGAAAAILEDLGITQIRLLTNNPDKVRLDTSRVEVKEVVPLVVGVGPENIEYLRTKVRLGHTLNLDSFSMEGQK